MIICFRNQINPYVCLRWRDQFLILRFTKQFLPQNIDRPLYAIIFKGYIIPAFHSLYSTLSLFVNMSSTVNTPAKPTIVQ